MTNIKKENETRERERDVIITIIKKKYTIIRKILKKKTRQERERKM